MVLAVDEAAAMQRQIDNAPILAQIAVIESRQHRAVREAALGSTAYLEQIEAQVAALRMQLA